MFKHFIARTLVSAVFLGPLVFLFNAVGGPIPWLVTWCLAFISWVFGEGVIKMWLTEYPKPNKKRSTKNLEVD